MKKIFLLCVGSFLIIQSLYAQDTANIITRKGIGQTQTPPMRLSCPCKLTWKITKMIPTNFFFLQVVPTITNDDLFFPPEMSDKNQGRYMIFPSGEYMLQIKSMTSWEIKIEQNYQR